MEVAGHKLNGSDFHISYLERVEFKVISINPMYKCAEVRNIVLSNI